MRPSALPSSKDLVALTAPLLARHRARWHGRWLEHEDQFVSMGVSASLAGSGRSLGELDALAPDLQTLLAAVTDPSGLTARSALDLVRAGRFDVLVGQPEGLWLDAKQQPYVLTQDAQKWELCKDVAAFANTASEALIVVGLATRKTPNGDVLDSPRPFPIANVDVSAIRAVLRERLTPTIPDIEVGVVETRAT